MTKSILSAVVLLTLAVAANASRPVMASPPSRLTACGNWCISESDCTPGAYECSACIHGQCTFIAPPAAPEIALK